MTALHVQTIILKPDRDYPLFITAKRYRHNPSSDLNSATSRSAGSEDSSSASEGLTLILLHSTSFHKETWEACLETMFCLFGSQRAGERPVLIREAWSIECPNHGQSAGLNAPILSTPEFSDHCERSLCVPPSRMGAKVSFFSWV